MEPSVLWKEEIFGGFKYLPWVFFFFLQGAAKPWTFLALHWRMGGDKFQGQLSFSLPQWVGRCLFCGLIHSKKFKENLCCGASFLSCFGAYLKKLVARVLLYFALFGLCIWFDLEQLSWSAVACEARGRSHIQSAVGYFLPEGEVIPLPYQWYYKSRLHIPHALILYLYLLNVTAYKYPGNILSNPYPATENTNTEDCRETQTLQSFFHICLSNGPGVHLMPCIRAHL